MFCVIYEFKIRTGKEDIFRAAWHDVTKEFAEKHGSLGARLHRSDEGTLIAYAQWPDRSSWEKSHIIIEQRSTELHLDDCLEGIPSVLQKMMIIDDLLVR